MKSPLKNNFVLQDIAIITLSVLVAIILAQSDALKSILESARQLQVLGSFVSGIFFTSVFTTAPAIVALGEISRSGSILLTALFGAMGAVIGDLLIFRFIKDRLSEHLLELIKHEKGWRRVKALVKLKYFRWFTFLAGGLLIASPFPDELGVSLLGISRTKTSLFILISFFFNFVGILAIGAVARSL